MSKSRLAYVSLIFVGFPDGHPICVVEKKERGVSADNVSESDEREGRVGSGH